MGTKARAGPVVGTVRRDRTWSRTAPKASLGAIYWLFFALATSPGAGARAQGLDRPATASSVSACARLQGMAVPAERVGMPTRGASVTQTHIVAASGRGGAAVGEHCLVSGVIRPVDAAAPDIRFDVALPTGWNGKALMIGGGGWDGVVPNVAESYYNNAPGALSPLGRGYAVFADDGGHAATKLEPGAFLSNEEALRNYTGDALKKTHDVAMAVITARYGRGPLKRYYIGGSGGGREAFQILGRWPHDYDGVIALYPGTSLVDHVLGYVALSRALAAPGAFLSPPKRAALFHAALEACDGLDGVKDGVISSVKRCNASFNPRTATVGGAPLRCPGGADTTDGCLSDAQLVAVETIDRPTPFAFRLSNGDTVFPGFNVYTSDTGVPNPSPIEAMVSFLAFGAAPPTFPSNPQMGLASAFADNFIRYGVARDPRFNPLTLDPSRPGRLIPRLNEIAANDTSFRDLSAFAEGGGKLLVMHGTADMIAAIRLTEANYEHQQAIMGPAKVASFYKFYEVPGFNHTLSTNFAAAWDYLTALENWSERGVDPADNQIVTDTQGVVGRTRPLCLYPSWPRYKGSGDVNDAASFDCAFDADSRTDSAEATR